MRLEFREACCSIKERLRCREGMAARLPLEHSLHGRRTRLAGTQGWRQCGQQGGNAISDDGGRAWRGAAAIGRGACAGVSGGKASRRRSMRQDWVAALPSGARTEIGGIAADGSIGAQRGGSEGRMGLKGGKSGEKREIGKPMTLTLPPVLV